MEFNNFGTPGGPGNNNFYNYNTQGYNPYYAQLQEARRLEKRAMLVNCSKLGALLIIYNICQYIFIFVYYMIVASVADHSLYLIPGDAVDYLVEHREIVDTTSFDMGGNLAVVLLSLAVMMLVAVFPMHIDLSQMLRPKRSHVPQALKWFPLCMTLNIAISLVVSMITASLSDIGVTVPEADFTIQTPDTLSLVLQFTYVIALGPIVEELIYRGVILTLLKPFGKGLAVFFSALIFGIMHGNIPQAASAFATALVFGIIAISCDSIVPTMIIHILNNTVASYMDFADVVKWGYAYEIYLGLQIVLIFAGIFVLMAYGRQLLFKDTRYAMTTGQRCAAVFTNIPMALYFIYAVYIIVKEIVQVN